MNDEIIYNPSAVANVNLDETSRYGADLFVTYALTEKLEASVNYTYVSAKIDGGFFDGSEVPLVPKHKLRSGDGVSSERSGSSRSRSDLYG